MKRIIRIIAIEFAGLALANEIASGLRFEDQFQAVLITTLALGLAMNFIKPIINILLLPLNLATMGAFKIVGHALTLFIVDLLLPQFEVASFVFAGYKTELFEIPKLAFEKGPIPYLAFSILIWFVTTLINWLRK